MAIGSNTYWIVVDVLNAEAVKPDNDKRRAYAFTSFDAANRAGAQWANARASEGRDGLYMIVRVPA